MKAHTALLKEEDTEKGRFSSSLINFGPCFLFALSRALRKHSKRRPLAGVNFWLFDIGERDAYPTIFQASLSAHPAVYTHCPQSFSNLQSNFPRQFHLTPLSAFTRKT